MGRPESSRDGPGVAHPRSVPVADGDGPGEITSLGSLSARLVGTPRKGHSAMSPPAFSLPHRPPRLGRILALLAAVLILKVTASVISHYDGYFPPDFASGFLRGREGHF